MRLIDAEPYAGCRIVANREDGGVSIDEIKTVDAVPVVRCGECERRVKSADLTDSVLCRWLHNLQMPKNGYCCYGERRSE